MQKMSTAGTGEICCTIPWKLRTELNNKEITFDNAVHLADTLAVLFRKKPVEIIFVHNRENCGTWGSACARKNFIRINRPSVCVLLHELAHIFAPERGHGPAFGKTLDTCYGLYLSYLRVRREHEKIQL